MKCKNVIKLLVLVAFAFITVGFSANASASTKVHYNNAYPKFVRGSWYQRGKFQGVWYGEYNKYTKKTAGGYSLYSSTRSGTSVIHNVHEKHVKINPASWYYPVYAGYVKKNNRTWYFTKYWTDKKSAPALNYYTSSKYKGHKVVVFADKNFKVTGIRYRTDKLAKKYWNKKISHFKYAESFGKY